MKLHLSILLIFLTVLLNGQELADTTSQKETSLWTYKGSVYVHLTQGAQFNWAKGGNNIFSTLTKSKASANYKKEKQIWNNELQWHYGFMLVGIPEDKSIDYRTSDDYIEINSNYGYKAKGKLYYNALFNFKSQWFPGYKYPNDSVKVSHFLSPAYLIFSVGMNYKPNDDFGLMLSPLTSKTTLVAKTKVDETQYGVKEGERIYREIGAYLKVFYNFKINKDIKTENNLTLFSNYQNHPENLDFELKSDISFQVSKNIKAMISLHFIYDDDAKIPVNKFIKDKYTQIGYTKGLQFQERVMLGLGYEF